MPCSGGGPHVAGSQRGGFELRAIVTMQVDSRLDHMAQQIRFSVDDAEEKTPTQPCRLRAHGGGPVPGCFSEHGHPCRPT
jgi:hypothetical protein